MQITPRGSQIAFGNYLYFSVQLNSSELLRFSTLSSYLLLGQRYMDAFYVQVFFFIVVYDVSIQYKCAIWSVQYLIGPMHLFFIPTLNVAFNSLLAPPFENKLIGNRLFFTLFSQATFLHHYQTLGLLTPYTQ